MKRILLLFSALLLSIIASWAHDVEIDGIYYNLDKTNKTAEVTSKNYWYYNYVYKGSVSIPENITYNSIVYCVTSIGEHAFWNCSGLTSITIPNSVTSIGESAFMWCSGLTSITIPNSVTSIGNGVFSACSGLTSITIPNSVTSIGNSVFSTCSGLTSITIPNSVTSIGYNAFYYCSDLTLVTIGNSVTSIGENAFLGCRGLTEIIVSPNNKHFVSEDGVLFNKEKTILIKYPEEKKDTSYVIPNSVTSIGESAFDGCSGLTSITIPNGVTSIGEYAFSGCSGLTKVNYLGSIDEWVDIDLKNITSNPMGHKKKFYINDELLTDVKITSADSINAYAFYNCKSIKSVEIGNSVTSIGSSAFYNCSGLTSVTIHNSVTSIGSSAFYDCSGLTSVTIPNSVTSIGEWAFSDCSGLTTVTIPNGVTSIGEYAFYNCSGLTSVTIPNSVTFIGYNAFSGCSGLTSVVWNAEKCSDFYFDYYNDNLVPPFYHVAPQITSFTLGKDVKHIPADLCSGMSNIKDIYIPSNVTSIGQCAFCSCTSLTSVVWNAKNFPEPKDYGPFYYSISPQITSFIFGVDVEHIPTFLCHGMTELKEIFIPKNISSIGKEAFSECTNLKKITMYPNTVPNTQGTETFANYNAYLYVPCDVYEDYDLDDVFGNFKYIKCIAAEEVDATDKVEIEVDEDNNAIVTWPSTTSAKTYELEISKDGEVFCTLLFNANGQLTSIDFGNRSASVGFQFTVTGLDGASKYSYSIVAKDEKGNELESYNGTFTTNGYSEETAILETLADANITVSGGTISADTDFTIYNTIGKDVTAQNGSLTPGVYVVKVADDIAKVMVK